MTVETIDGPGLAAVFKANDGRSCYGIRLLESALINTTKKTWAFIKEELNGLPDMTYTCVNTSLYGLPAKQLIFSGMNELALMKTMEFVRATVNDGATVAVACTVEQAHIEHEWVMSGDGANCPLFSQ